MCNHHELLEPKKYILQWDIIHTQKTFETVARLPNSAGSLLQGHTMNYLEKLKHPGATAQRNWRVGHNSSTTIQQTDKVMWKTVTSRYKGGCMSYWIRGSMRMHCIRFITFFLFSTGQSCKFLPNKLQIWFLTYLRRWRHNDMIQ